MLIQSISLLVASTVTLALSQSDCSPKFRSADGQPCAYLAGKPDTLRILSSIHFTFPSPGEKTSPESRQKLRRWTDSVFNNHDIRYPDAREVRALPPPDSQLWWIIQNLLIEKSSLLALAEESFIDQIALAQSQSSCSPKFFSAENGHSCEYFVGKPDTFRIISAIAFPRPPLGEEKLPENMQNLRKWTDSLFNKYDFRNLESRDVRALPPPDSLLWWETRDLLVEKSSLQALAEVEFVKLIQYREKPVETAVLRPWPIVEVVPQHGRYHDALGRLITPLRNEIPRQSQGMKVRFRHRR